jgi:hypothetical protein
MRPTYDERVVASARALDYDTALKQYIVASQGAKMQKDILAFHRDVLMYKTFNEESPDRNVLSHTVTKNGEELPIETITMNTGDYRIEIGEVARQNTSLAQIKRSLKTLLVEAQQRLNEEHSDAAAARMVALEQVEKIINDATSVTTHYELEVRATEE